MAAGKLFERNVRPRRMTADEDDIDEYVSGQDSDGDAHSESDLEPSKLGGDNTDSLDEDGDEDGDDRENGQSGDGASQEEQEDAGGRMNDYLSTVSFGALKQAHDSLSRKRKRGSDINADQEDKLEALRERLRQIRQDKSRPSAQSTKSNPTSQKGRHTEDESDSNSDSDSSDAESADEGGAPRARTSKHAPMAQTSKRQVTRRRQVVDVPKRVVRDPRFDALQQQGPPPSGGHSDKAYGFIQEYQKAEIEELKTALKQTKNDEDRATLRRKLNSMQNTLKTKAAKEREQEIVRRHRREEREQIQQGKTPYFLKRKEIKELALVEKFKGMKSKEREKLMEKRRLKESQREKRRMPEARRRV